MVAFDALPADMTLNEMAEVTFRLPSRQAVLNVPPGALVRQGGQSGVFLADGGRAWFAVVTTGVRTANGVEILDGVAEGALVVTQRARPLVDGDRLRVSNDGAG